LGFISTTCGEEVETERMGEEKTCGEEVETERMGEEKGVKIIVENVRK